MRNLVCWTVTLWLSLVLLENLAAASTTAREVSVMILSSNLANGSTVGEWGFSALVKVDDHCILFDTGGETARKLYYSLWHVRPVFEGELNKTIIWSKTTSNMVCRQKPLLSIEDGSPDEEQVVYVCNIKFSNLKAGIMLERL